MYEEMRRLVSRFFERYGKAEAGPVLMLTDRIARLPGIKEMMADIENCNFIKLEPGAGALGLLRFTSPLFEQQAGNSSPFLTSRPLPAAGHISKKVPGLNPAEQRQPTHILYRNLAYPITENPLIVGLERIAGKSGIQIQGQIAGVSRKHCVVKLEGNQVVLEDHSTYGTFVDENPVKRQTILLLGQTVRVGTPGETLNLIACLDREAGEA